ncbi:hypothetical protein [Montanilutibacter psychrotolerans]|uniref:hypothetical protein n=1 Tax=Montanilutibacter psychrotolerans TaxID=1327343 RepID=UPI0011CDF910|nr:hypothetical protein [Lysobacter psychrotolerans]
MLIPLILLSCIPRAAACDGWIRLSATEVQGQTWRDAAPTKFLSATLDMDGDGELDVAAIVVSRDSKRSAIRICFGGSERRQQCQIIAVSENIADVMGLEKKGPGCYSYAEDDVGRPSRGRQICGRNDMLEYFKFGSAGSFFVYETNRNTLGRYWGSD